MATNTTAAYKQLLDSLSQIPPSTCRSERIAFKNVGLPMYENHFALVIHDALSQAECEQLLRVAQDAHSWEEALVNVGNGRQKLYTDIRLCDRILWDNQEIASRILDRILPHLPSDIQVLSNRPSITGNGPVKRKETLRISRLNDRLRFLKYTKGNYFRPHCDGSYATPGNEEITFMTVHLYLNGGERSTQEDCSSPQTRRDADAAKPLLGGATRFFSPSMEEHWDFNPKAASILIFQHRGLLHSGEDVTQGTKYTMRSDILYRKTGVPGSQPELA